MGSITLNKPSGGQLTLSPEDGTTNETVTIPSVGVGKILQVQSGSKGDTFSTTITSSLVWTDTGISASITPTSTTSKINITWNVDQLSNSDMNGGYSLSLRLAKVVDGVTTPVGVGNAEGSRAQATSHIWMGRDSDQYSTVSTGGVYLDAPATTSEITYKIQITSVYTSGGNVLRINRANQDNNSGYNGRSISTVTLMEVAQ